MTERCASTAALGRPVVPAVKMISAGSSSLPGAGVGTGASTGTGPPASWAARTSSIATTAGPRPAGSRLAMSASATITAGPSRPTAWAISASFHHWLPGATTAPSNRPAHSEMTQSGELRASSSNRSPGRSPWLARYAATWVAAAAIRANVTRRLPWTRWSRSAQRCASSSSSVTRDGRCR